jgi:hypothetical protein
LLLALAVLAMIAASCGGDEPVVLQDCGQDTQTGARQTWTHSASRCFRDRFQNEIPAFARVVESRSGVGLATVEYTSDGSDTYTLRIIPSGSAAIVSKCTRLGASTIDNKTQLDPLDCEPLS